MRATTHPKRQYWLLALLGILAVLGTSAVALPAHAAAGNTITGIVHLGIEDGAPAAGAGAVKVTYGYSTSTSEPRPSIESTAVLTDASGRFTFADLPDGQYNVYFTPVGTAAGNFLAATSDYLGSGHSMFGGRTADLGLALVRVITVAGHVTLGPDGISAGAGEVEVSLWRSGVFTSTPLATTSTDAAGDFRFENVRAADAELVFRHVDSVTYHEWTPPGTEVTAASRTGDNWDVEIPGGLTSRRPGSQARCMTRQGCRSRTTWSGSNPSIRLPGRKE